MTPTSKSKKHQLSSYIILALILLMVALGIMSSWYMQRQIRLVTGNSIDVHSYDFHIAMISETPKDPQWIRIVNGARDFGSTHAAYVENFGENLFERRGIQELMQMAIASNVDGIILIGENSHELVKLVNMAKEQEIPVVLLLTDMMESARISFVGLNNYSLGTMYGTQLVELSRAKQDHRLRVSVLTETVGDTGLSGVIYRGIFEALGQYSADMEIQSFEVGSHIEFEVEEQLRELLLSPDGHPDVIVCLSATTTAIALQSLVDYNLVGQVQILGTSDNELILNGIEMGIILSTVFINESGMGSTAIDLLLTYLEFGTASEYSTVQVQLITRENLSQFLPVSD